MRQGQSTWYEDYAIPIFRNGRMEEVYWTWSDTHTRQIRPSLGILVTVVERTASVNSQRHLQQEKTRIANIFQQVPAFFAVLGGPDFKFEMVNHLFQELIGDREVMGKPVREAVPESVEQGFLDLLEGVYTTGKAFVGQATPLQLARIKGEPLELRHLDFVYEPRREPDGSISGIIVLGIDVTEKQNTERALRASESRSANSSSPILWAFAYRTGSVPFMKGMTNF